MNDSESDEPRGGGLLPIAQVLDNMKSSYDAQIARRMEWWSQREIADGAKEKGWRWVRKLILPPDITREEIAALEPCLDWAQQRLDQCSVCPKTGGACDVDYYMGAGEGTAPVWNAETRDVEFKPCGRFYEHRLRKRLAGFGVPEVLLGATFETFSVNDDLRDELQAYVANFKDIGAKGYYLDGGVGTGKSHLAAAVTRELVRKRLINSAYFAYVPKFFDEIRNNFDRSVEERDEFMERSLHCDLLVMDDLGAERTTEWVRDQLGIIIHMRWANQKPVLVTSNKTMDEYRDLLGERAYSRLRSLTPYRRVIGGRDQR